MFDDILNYKAVGWCLNNGKTLLGMVLFQTINWFKRLGRVYPLGFSPYIVLSLLSLPVYKLLTVIITYLNGVLIAYIIKKCTGRVDVSKAMLIIFPVLISLNGAFFNSMFGFCFLIQMCFIWMLLSALCFIKYLENEKITWQVISCSFICLGLSTYEVAFALCIIFPIISIFWNKKIDLAIRKIIPQICTGILWLVLTIYAQMTASEMPYNRIDTILFQVLKTFFYQISGSTSWGNWYFLLTNYSKDLGIYIKTYSYRYLLVLSLFIVFFIAVRKMTLALCHLQKQYIRKKTNLFLIVLSLSIIIFPSILTALSVQHQSQIVLFNGYLPAYVSCWGISLLCAMLFIKINKKNILSICLMSILLIFLLGNQIIGDITSNKNNNRNYIIDCFVSDAINTDLFSEVHEGIRLIDGSSGFTEPANAYAYFLNHKMDVASNRQLYAISKDGIFTLTEEYENLDTNNYYYTRYVTGSFDFIGLCHDLLVYQNSDRTVRESMYANEFKIYIPKNSLAKGITFILKTGETYTIELASCTVIKTSESGTCYSVKSNSDLDLNTISLIYK